MTMQQTLAMTTEAMNERIRCCPFNQWLGLEVIAASTEHLKMRAAWRDEMLGNPDTGAVHGGILSAILDAAAFYTVAAATGRIGATLDMRVDYHRPAQPGDLVAHGSVVKAGRSINTVDIRVHDVSGKMVCSGRAVYYLSGE